MVSTASPNSISSGLCSLTFAGQVFQFRTNPNEIWWSYELLSNVEETYGGRVIQVLGTRLGDLSITVDCGWGGFNYLMEVVLMLRDLMSDQRNGNPATFTYTTRNYMLNVYAMNIPFQDQFDATVRTIPLNFKIQEDVTGVLSQVTLDAALAALVDGVSTPGTPAHNTYNDVNGVLGGVSAQLGSSSNLLTGITDPQAPGGPTYTPAPIINNVDSNPLGTNAAGLNPLGQIPFLPNIPGIGTLLGGSV
jgi:hypothetical protein